MILVMIINYLRMMQKKKLNKIIFEIKENKSKNKIVSSFLNLSQNCLINNKIPIELIKGVIKDLSNVNIKTLDELIIYSFQVAGTVGLMMCCIMNVRQKSLEKPALQLGIAMQLTNISRDVKEDLLMNRIYLPSEIRSFKYTNSNELLSNVKKKKKASNDVLKLIELSENFYNLSLCGVNALPFNHKFPILLALELYKNIGYEIKKNKIQIWKKRVYVSKIRKIIITFQCLINTIFFNFKKKRKSYMKDFDFLIKDKLEKLK